MSPELLEVPDFDDGHGFRAMYDIAAASLLQRARILDYKALNAACMELAPAEREATLALVDAVRKITGEIATRMVDSVIDQTGHHT